MAEAGWAVRVGRWNPLRKSSNGFKALENGGGAMKFGGAGDWRLERLPGETELNRMEAFSDFYKRVCPSVRTYVRPYVRSDA